MREITPSTDFEANYKQSLYTVADYWGLPVQPIEDALKKLDDELDASIVRIHGEDALLPASISEIQSVRLRIPVVFYEEIKITDIMGGVELAHYQMLQPDKLKWIEGVPYHVEIQNISQEAF